MRSLGIILIILGILALIYTGFTYTTTEEVAEIGPLEVNKEKEHSVNWPPILGAIMLVGGIVLVATDRKKV
jgi:uncharacterized membrane protein